MSLWEKRKRKVAKKLKKYWGYSSLKPKQIEIISNFVDGKDVVGLLPTGYGKSMCYLVPPLITKKTIFIISPLISLMDDQKEKLLKRGIPVSALHGNNSRKDKEVFDIIDNKIHIVYMSPEYLINGDGMELAKTLFKDGNLGYFAVDESHCISVWGHDFRKSYLKLYKFRKKFPTIPILAVTATATDIVVKDIVKNLRMKNNLMIHANFDRPNLYIKCVNVFNENLRRVGNKYCLNGALHVLDSKNKCKKCKINPKTYNYNDEEFNQLRNNKKRKFVPKLSRIDLMKKYLNKYENDKIIIYCTSRKETVEVADDLNNIKKGFAEAYHAGMSKKLRERIQSNFSSGKVNIIVSTIAFGMGIDQIVRCVLIFGASSSIEEYYQQIGRAGRDGLPAETILFYEDQQMKVKIEMIKKESSSKILKDIKIQNVNNMRRLCFYTGCRRRFILEYFKERTPKFFCCYNCDNCSERDLVDFTEKVWEILYSNKDARKLFNKNEIELLKKNNILRGTKKYFKTDYLNFWKGLIEFKKYKLETIPDKLKIKVL